MPSSISRHACISIIPARSSAQYFHTSPPLPNTGRPSCAQHRTHGYVLLLARHISQADKGCDFDFLEGTTETPEPEIR